MTQGVMTPPNPPSTPSTASSSGVARCWHSNAYFRYFLRYFSSTHRTDLSRFRGTFHSFDPVGFAIFAIPRLALGVKSRVKRVNSHQAVSIDARGGVAEKLARNSVSACSFRLP